MLTPIQRAPHAHDRRASRVEPAACDATLACGRRHAVLVAAHRLGQPAKRPDWLRWLELRLQPGQKVF